MEHHFIAAEAARQLNDLKGIIAGVRQGDMPEIDDLFDRVIDRLNRTSATVSVVGQVKAGKSSLINALAGIGDLLPTEVNPWTAVITNLHFGHDGQSDGSAVFQLFSEEEWGRMLQGGSEARKLAEELLPGFKSDVLDRQILEMQQKAKKRLGDLYHFLLGKQHKFNMITPEILERYVSAGYSDTDISQSTAGRFSCITKSADVYLAPGPFQLPITLCDTPGINDPFLVRDEITTNSLTQADIFIVTLSAHQLMNAADIGLLKMLSHHPRKRTIVFVNRIDQLDDPVTNVPGVVANLEKRLAEEIENPNHIIIAGSAEWAWLAANGTDAAIAEAVAGGAPGAYYGSLGVGPAGSPREMLFVASGLSALAEQVSEIVMRGRIRFALEAATAETLAGMNVLGSALSERLARETVGPMNADDINDVAEAEIRRIEQRVGFLGELSQTLAQVSDEGMQKLFENCDVVSRTVISAIKAAVDKFIDEQIEEYRTSSANEGRVQTWALDTGAIEAKVQQQVIASFRRGRSEMDHVLLGYASRLNEAISRIAGELQLEALLENLPFDDILPGFQPKANIIDVAMTANRGWKFWKSKRLSDDEAIARISRVVRAELYPSVCNLELAVQEGIGERNGVAIERLSNLVASADRMLQSEIASLRADASELTSDFSEEKAAAIFEERRRRNESLKARIADLEAARRVLNERFPHLVDESASGAKYLHGNAHG